MPEIIKRKALTIEDLVKFCKENKMYSFNSKDQGYKLSVQVPATFEVDENVDENHRGMLKLKFKIFHTGLNRNGSFVSEEAAKDAMPTIKNRPIMAAIHQLDNGEWDFESHNFEIVKNEETGEEEVVYIEKQVGSFDESDPFFEYDEELDKTFVCGYGYIAEDYTKACDIIRRKNGTKNSCELNIDEFSFNVKENYLSLDKFYVSASTLLGSRSDGTEIGEGMEGSRADIAEFSTENNSMFSQKNMDKVINNKLIETLEALNNTLSKFNINQAEFSADATLEEGGNQTVTKFEELMQKYNKTESDINFEIEGLSDEELEAKFAEVFEEEDDDSDSGITDTNACGGGSKKKKKKKNELDSHTIKCSIESNGNTKTYEISLQDKIYAIQDLVNITYSESDNTYYGVQVYENYVVMVDYWSGRAYKQSYSEENDSYTLTGDRVEVYSVWVTKEEEEALEEMKANYALLEKFKVDTENAQLHAQRETILSDKKYSVLTEKDENNEYKNKAYAKLVSEMDNYSLIDLEKELKSVFADYITNGGQFAYAGEPEDKPKVSKKLFGNSTEKKTSRYGNLFSK